MVTSFVEVLIVMFSFNIVSVFFFFALAEYLHAYFRCSVLVSGDSTGTVQFWDSQHGTLLEAHSNHKGDVNTLAASPSHNRVFSAGADGQVNEITRMQ